MAGSVRSRSDEDAAGLCLQLVQSDALRGLRRVAIVAASVHDDTTSQFKGHALSVCDASAEDVVNVAASQTAFFGARWTRPVLRAQPYIACVVASPASIANSLGSESRWMGVAQESRFEKQREASLNMPIGLHAIAWLLRSQRSSDHEAFMPADVRSRLKANPHGPASEQQDTASRCGFPASSTTKLDRRLVNVRTHERGTSRPDWLLSKAAPCLRPSPSAIIRERSEAEPVARDDLPVGHQVPIRR